MGAAARPKKRPAPPPPAAAPPPAGKRAAPPPPPPDASPAPAVPADAVAPDTPDRRVNVIEVNGKACTHEVAWPPSDPRAALPGASAPPPPSPRPPAKRYPFPLDPFQSTAVACLEAGHSVMVAAHTSAGKTVVAEYAFAAALRDGARAVYTSPLKALSNQKYRELAAEFKDVGLMTGDVTINPGASCLVMTTEVLRSMLYNRSDTVTEARTLIFDEVHYLRDAERGVVWEEAIALAPKAARFAFLSATLPNAAEFAAWVASTHGTPVHVVYTDYRPTPLVQYVFPAGGAGLHLCVDEGGAFRAAAFSRALADLDAAAAADGGDGSSKQRAADKAGGGGSARGGVAAALGTAAGAAAADPDMRKLVTMLTARRYDPAIVFSFSKRECEAHARALADVDLNDEAEAALVARVYAAAVDVLSPEDRALPQVAGLLPTLRRGVGVHHSGLLPVLKEVTELLFGEGLVKVLFATETFSTGLNMPAKTVVFTGTRKWDGGRYRTLTAGEYTQMAGRAGRRGLDERGVVVLMLDARLEPSAARALLRGGSDPLTSAFRLSYGGLLTMTRAPDACPRSLLEASFAQFQARRALPALAAAATAARAAADAASVPGDEAALSALADARSAAGAAARAARDAAVTPAAAAPFLVPGRLVLLRGARADAPGAPPPDPAASDAAWGAVVGFQRVRGGGTKAAPDDVSVDVVAAWGEGDPPSPLPASSPAGAPAVRTLSLTHVDALSSVRIHLGGGAASRDLRSAAARAAAVAALAEVGRRFPGGVPLLDPVADLGAGASPAYAAAAKRAADLAAVVARHPLSSAPDLPARLAALASARAARAAADAADAALTAASGLVFEAGLAARTRVLRKMGHIDADGVITLKGRAAAELASAGGAELALAEVVFGGGLAGVRPDALAALLACVAWREPASPRGPARVPDAIEGPLSSLRAAARRVARLEGDVGLEGAVAPDDAAASFSADVAEPVLAWARGARFTDALKAGDGGLFEGSLVRVLRRVEELARQLGAAAAVVGDAGLADAAAAAGAKIKRGVPFAPSLYL